MASGEFAFLFTDLAGSSRLWEEHAKAMEVALAEHDAILRDAIAAHGGEVFSTMGDGLAAVFADAPAAAAAAVDAQRALTTHGWQETGPLRVRMGIHVGAAQRRGSDYFGPTLNRCARLMGVGHGGQILVSRAACDGLGNETDVRDLGEHRLRDLSAAERVFQLLHPELEAEFPALLSLESRPGNLPLQATTFVGRAEEVLRCAALLGQARFVTLTGVGGVGKTRLALQTAAESLPRFPDGAWLCELAPVTDPGAVDYAVATALGVRPASGQPAAEAVLDWLRNRRLLLVLDNCEHVLDAIGRLVEDILRTAADVTVLATSREALAVEGEVTRAVRSLEHAGAVQLFSERAAGVRPDFVLSAANDAAVDDIVERLDGVPLAIELAAARVASMSPSEISTRLGERFRLLTGGRRTAVERQRTLRGTVDWSFGLLTPVEQRVFAHLSVFAGGCTLDAAEAVCRDAVGDGDDQVLDLVESLVRKSMVVVEERDGSTRYSMLETLRQYAEEQLVAKGDSDGPRRLHGQYFVDFVEAGRLGLRSRDEGAWMRRLDADFDNFRSAWLWAVGADEAVLGARLVAALFWYAFMRMRGEYDEWANVAIGLVDELEPAVVAGVYVAASACAWLRGDSDRARHLANEGLELPGLNAGRQVELMVTLMNAALLRGEFDESIAVGQAGLTVLRASDEPWMLALELSDVSLTFAATGRVEEALALAREGLAHGRELANPTTIAFGLYGIGEALLEVDPDEAVTFLAEAVAIADDVGNRFMAGVAALSLTSALGRSGMPLLAVPGYIALLDQWASAGNQSQQWVTLRNACEMLGRVGDAEVVAGVYGAMQKHGTEPAPNTAEGDRMAVTVDSARAALDSDAFQAAMDRGRTMSCEEVAELVRGGLERFAASADA